MSQCLENNDDASLWLIVGALNNTTDLLEQLEMSIDAVEYDHTKCHKLVDKINQQLKIITDLRPQLPMFTKEVSDRFYDLAEKIGKKMDASEAFEFLALKAKIRNFKK